MLRRFILWAAILFVLVGGALTGHHSGAQEDDSHLLMLLSNYDSASRMYTFSLFDPANANSQPLSVQEVVEYLRAGLVKTDVLTDIYQWRFFESIDFRAPRSGLVAYIIAQHYIPNGSVIFAQPSNDWQWLVVLASLDTGAAHVYSINLMTGTATDLFANNGLYFNNDDFHVVISSDSVYVNAANEERENALYRLRLDGNNPEEIEPFEDYDWMPLYWLEESNYLLFSESWMIEGRPISFLNAGVLDEQGLGGIQTAFHTTEALQPHFEVWLPKENTLIYSTWDYESDDVSVIGYSLSEAGVEWGLLQWSVISLTDDHQWMLLRNADGDMLGRMRTDGSQFEVVAEFPESVKQAEGSPNGWWAVGLSSSSIYRIDMSTGVITRLRAVENNIWVQLNHSSISPDGMWISYWRPHPTERRLELVLLNEMGERVNYSELEENTFLAWVTLDELP